MVISDKDYRPETQRFLRHYFFEKRFIFLEGPMTEDYTSDPTMPFGWSTSPRGVIDQILYLALEPQPIRLIINSPSGSV
ncbi:MAG: hypothetical protein HYW88_02840, partial [Candidatus Sungbacteria bacterium]|nr:hypothetical protein [Candidatus Sungbacteria bacterium]